MRRWVSLFALLTSLGGSAHADVLRDKMSASAGAGVGILKPLGYFGQEFKTGISVELNGRLPLARFFAFSLVPGTSLFFGANFQFTNLNLAAKTSSTMTNISLGAGPGIVYHFNRWFQPAASVEIGAFYNRLSLASRNESYNAVNPFARLRCGFFTEVDPAVFLEASVAAPFYYLGSDNLFGVEASIAANYVVQPTEIVESPADKLYIEGKKLYESQLYEAADAKFAEALSVDAKHERAAKYRVRIKAQAVAQKGRSLRNEGDLWGALPLLVQAFADLPELAPELRELRAQMAGNVQRLVNEGVAAYDAKRYAECEAAMERVLLISPDHESAKIYLPRARSRRKAMEKMQ